MKTAANSQRRKRNGQNTGFTAWPVDIAAAWSRPHFARSSTTEFAVDHAAARRRGDLARIRRLGASGIAIRAPFTAWSRRKNRQFVGFAFA
jgi:hypothetical protein